MTTNRTDLNKAMIFFLAVGLMNLSACGKSSNAKRSTLAQGRGTARTAQNGGGTAGAGQAGAGQNGTGVDNTRATGIPTEGTAAGTVRKQAPLKGIGTGQPCSDDVAGLECKAVLAYLARNSDQESEIIKLNEKIGQQSNLEKTLTASQDGQTITATYEIERGATVEDNIRVILISDKNITQPNPSSQHTKISVIKANADLSGKNLVEDLQKLSLTGEHAVILTDNDRLIKEDDKANATADEVVRTVKLMTGQQDVRIVKSDDLAKDANAAANDERKILNAQVIHLAYVINGIKNAVISDSNITVKLGDTTLEKDTDYVVNVENNSTVKVRLKTSVIEKIKASDTKITISIVSTGA
jgi:hypothetical protein